METTGLQEIDPRTEDMPAEKTGMEVQEDYKRGGITTRMVELLVDQLGELIPGKKNEGRGGENALTDEGLLLTIALQKKNLILPFPEERPYDDE